MTIPTLPTVSLGNFATDISGAAAGFIKGLQAEKQRRQEQAMKEALLQVQLLRAQRPDASDFRLVQEPQPDGTLKQVRVNMLTGERLPMADIQAPVQQFVSVGETPEHTLTQLTTPRIAPGGGGPSHATQVTLPGGQQPRDISPAVLPIETANGPEIARIPRRVGQAEIIHAPGGAPLQPVAKPGEVNQAQFASSMFRAAEGMKQIANTAPGAVDEAVTRLNIQAILQTLPVIGAPVGEVARAVQAMGLSEEAANWLVDFHTFLGSAIPELAGKQMTITELRQYTQMFAPMLGEPVSARQAKMANIDIRVQNAMRAAGPGMTRIGQPQAPPPVHPAAPPIDPRFDPRNPQRL